jgi:hypothetical protein
MHNFYYAAESNYISDANDGLDNLLPKLPPRDE